VIHAAKFIKVSYGENETMTDEPPKNRETLDEDLLKSARIATDHGHYGIRIDRDAVWWRDGLPFTRPSLVKLFSTVLLLDDDRQYWLQTPAEKGRIDVDDVPFTAIEMAKEDGVIKFRTNLDEWVTLDADHPLRVGIDSETDEPRPYITVRSNLEARLLRPVYYELAGSAEEQDGAFYVTSGGVRFRLGEAEA